MASGKKKKAKLLINRFRRSAIWTSIFFFFLLLISFHFVYSFGVYVFKLITHAAAVIGFMSKDA